jgi:hypothetical protein
METLVSGDPQFRQKRAPSGFFVPHRGQTITASSVSTGWLARAVARRLTGGGRKDVGWPTLTVVLRVYGWAARDERSGRWTPIWCSKVEA